MTDENSICEGSSFCGNFTYFGKPVLGYEVCYPIIKQTCLLDLTTQVNRFYKNNAVEFVQSLRQTTYPLAASHYRNLAPCGEFDCWQVRRQFSQMYSRTALSSVFCDTYCKSSGDTHVCAREAFTFSAKCGKMDLRMFFKQGYCPDAVILDTIYAEICKEEAASPHTYYIDWQDQLSRCYNPANFYLADDGFVVFFPQKTLASSVYGILSYLIPYENFGSRLNCEL